VVSEISGVVKSKTFTLPRYIYAVINAAITSVNKWVIDVAKKSVLISALNEYLPYKDINYAPSNEEVRNDERYDKLIM
jgi:hypothetical protein